MNILVTGGAGYIGSHTVIELIAHGHQVVIVDNFANSNPEVLRRLETLTNTKLPFFRGEVQDKDFLRQIFAEYAIDAAIHFAGFKAVGDSVKQPLSYYRNNLDSLLALCECMDEKGVHKLLFSSSATVYGDPAALPIPETSPIGQGITNPYGQTKYMIEQILEDLAVSDPSWAITALRYFNPIGAHHSGLIGEDPNGTPTNLLPYVSQVTVGKLEKLRIYGDDYPTPDGTGVRDYIHVVDLARGHVAALEHLQAGGHREAYNLGTGRGVSVLDMVRAFEHASGKTIPYEVVARRSGDVAVCYADVAKAAERLAWRAEKTLEEACADSWRWQSQNPHGYAGHQG